VQRGTSTYDLGLMQAVIKQAAMGPGVIITRRAPLVTVKDAIRVMLVEAITFSVHRIASDNLSPTAGIYTIRGPLGCRRDPTEALGRPGSSRPLDNLHPSSQVGVNSNGFKY